MQWLFEGSSEAPGCRGLGVLAGSCARLDDRGGTLKIPHVGWNALAIATAVGAARRAWTTARTCTSRTRTPRP